MNMNLINVEKVFNLENINLKLLPEEFVNDLKTYVSFLFAETAELIQSKKNENVAKTIKHYCEITEKLGLNKQFNFPIKFGIPAFDKIGLEEDEDLQKEWAKLLIAASKEYNSIHLQYADILSQIDGDEARLLKEIYYSQIKKDGINALNEYEKAMADFHNGRTLKDSLRKLDSEISRKINGSSLNRNRNSLDIKLSSAISFSPLLRYGFPLFIEGEAEKIDWGWGSPPSEMFTKTNKFTASLMLLQKLDLIKYNFESRSAGNGSYKPRWGLLLTPFAYEFIKTLEEASNQICNTSNDVND